MKLANIIRWLNIANRVLQQKANEVEEEASDNALLPSEELQEVTLPSPHTLGGGAITAFQEMAPSEVEVLMEAAKVLAPPDTGSTGSLPASAAQDVKIDIPADYTVTGGTLEDSGQNWVIDDEAPDPENDNDKKRSLLQMGFLIFLGILAYLRIRKGYIDGREGIVTDNLEEVLTLIGAEAHAGDIPTSSGWEDPGNILTAVGLKGARITSRFKEDRGYRHEGVDVAVPIGTPLYSPFNGVVNYVASNVPKAGNLIQIVREDGLYSVTFMHLSTYSVRVGDKVQAGQKVAESGNTDGGAKRADGRPWSTGPHAHVELRRLTRTPILGQSIKYISVPIDPLGPTAPIVRAAEEVNIITGVPYVPVTYPASTTIGKIGNNLLSITGTDAWIGKTGEIEANGKIFPTFRTPAEGLRAGAIVLQKYQTVYDVSDSGGEYVTVADIARRYLDAAAGDRPAQWARAVEQGGDIEAGARLDLRDRNMLAQLLRGVAYAEHTATLPQAAAVEVLDFYSNDIYTIIPSNQQ